MEGDGDNVVWWGLCVRVSELVRVLVCVCVCVYRERQLHGGLSGGDVSGTTVLYLISLSHHLRHIAVYSDQNHKD